MNDAELRDTLAKVAGIFLLTLTLFIFGMIALNYGPVGI